MDVSGKRVTVIGMGRTALSVVKLLLREGAEPFVSDSADKPTMAPMKEELAQLAVPFECGQHDQARVAASDIIIPSPGVPPSIPVIERAVRNGAEIMGEMEFASRYCRSRVLAVTGTNGKTTTTELLRALARACGHSVLLAGNNDYPFSAAVMAEPAPEYIVLEVSSYQLETARTFRPWLGAVLNLTPDHLARHGTMEEYARVKAGMFARQGEGDAAVVNADDPWTSAMTVPPGVVRRTFSVTGPVSGGLWLDGETIREGSEAMASAADTPLPGRHNMSNVLAALTMMRAGGFDWAKTLEGLRQFHGVEHRIEHVVTQDGVAWYNDSKSTNIDSLRVALESFGAPIVLLAGGEGKGADYGVLRDLVKERVKRLVAFGQDAPLLEAALHDIVPCERADDMADVVERAKAAAAPGDIVLLSPACASFDMFANFEERGRVFKACVRSQVLGEGEEA